METNLLKLTDIIQKKLNQKEVTVCIEGIFDNTSYEALERKGIDSVTSKWIWNLLTTRKAETKVVERTIIRVSTIKECPQGEVLSTLMWSMAIDEILGQLTEKGVPINNFFDYTDYIIIMPRKKVEGTLCELLLRGIVITRRWCSSVG